MAGNEVPEWVKSDVQHATRRVPAGWDMTVKLEGKRVSVILTKLRLGGDREEIIRELKARGWKARSNPARKWVEASKATG